MQGNVYGSHITFSNEYYNSKLALFYEMLADELIT